MSFQQNTEPHLPQYICEDCTKNLDAAYEFKRKYEDSIVKFLRRTSYHDEDEEVGNSFDTDTKMFLPDEVQDGCEQQDVMDNIIQNTMHGVHQLNYQEINQSDVPQEIDIEEMDVKSILDLPPPSPAISLDVDENTNQIKEEIAGISNRNDYAKEPNLNVSCESVQDVMDEQATVPEELSILHSGVISDQENSPRDMENECTSGVISHLTQPLAEQCLNSDLRIDQKPGEEVSFKPNTNLPDGKKIMAIEEPKALLADIFNVRDNSRGVDKNLRIEKRDFRTLRSDSHPISSPIFTYDILKKIYTVHGQGMKRYRCDVCFRYFKTKGHVKTHRMLHIEATKQIKCKKCPLTFLTKAHYENHKCSLDLC